MNLANPPASFAQKSTPASGLARKLTASETRRGLQLWELRKQHATLRREIGTGAHTRPQTELLTLLQKAHRLESEINALAGGLEAVA